MKSKFDLKSWKKAAGKRLQPIPKRLRGAEQYLLRWPLITLSVVLIVLLGVIAVSNWLREPKNGAQTEQTSPTPVRTFAIGESPRIEAIAQVEKTGVVQIVAQSGGIVQRINVEPGDEVGRGRVVVSLASNSFGGNAPAIQRQIVERQLENLENTLPLQKDAIEKQRQLAKNQEDNAEELREITEASIGETEDLLELNEEILESLDLVLQTSTDSAEIMQTKQLKAQLLSGVIQLRAQLRQSRYQSDDDNPPAELARLQRDLTLKQLEIQEKSLELNKEVTELQVKLAKVQEAVMYPATPFAGRVERVHVRVGQAVNPGQVLVTLDCDALATQLVAKVSADTAARVSRLEPSLVQIGNEVIELTPDYVSQEATHGQLYSVLFTLPEFADVSSLTDQGSVTLSLPLGQADTGNTVPFVPLDAVHQNEQSSQVFILTPDNTVASREVQLAAVQGRFVEITDGIESGDRIILNRNVIPGETVVESQN